MMAPFPRSVHSFVNFNFHQERKCVSACATVEKVNHKVARLVKVKVGVKAVELHNNRGERTKVSVKI